MLPLSHGALPGGRGDSGPKLRERLDPDEAAERVYNFLHTLTIEAQLFARACGKTYLHSLEPEDLAALTMEASFCLGAAESAEKFGMRDEKAMLRVLTPLAKLFTAKQVVWAASEGLEFFGGQGYIEKTGIPGKIALSHEILPSFYHYSPPILSPLMIA